MRILRPALILLFMISWRGHSQAGGLAFGQPPGLLCRAAIAAVERTARMPDHLLAAIGRVESGRPDGGSGEWHPWPWTINAEGQGAFFESKAEAIAAVRALQARGVRSIDVGCMQVNLMHHPDAFASLEQAFDPPANVAYAARFLTSLFGQTKSWPKAAALYHSATQELGDAYRRQVEAAWSGESRRQQEASRTAGLGLTAADPLRAWAAALPAAPSNRVAVVMPPNPRHAIRIIPINTTGNAAAARMSNAAGAPWTAQGRGLEAYRAAPVAMIVRPLRRGG